LETRSTGRTALLAATRGRHAEIVQMLLAAGADPNGTSWLGESAVHCAARELRTELLGLLVRGGGYGPLPDGDGKTASQLAAASLSAIRVHGLHAFPHLSNLAEAETAFEGVRTILAPTEGQGAAATKLAKKALAPRARDAHALKLVKGANPDPRGTEVRGDAWLPPDSAWPSCDRCGGTPLHLLIRVRCSDFGIEPAGQLSVFQCIHYGATSPNGGTLDPPLVKVLYHPQNERLERRAHPGGFPAKPNHLSAGKPKVEYPSPLLSDPLLDWTAVAPEARHMARHLSQDVDKVGGWPAVAEPSTVPSCSECGLTTSLVLQLGGASSKIGLYHSVDRLFIFQCAEHPEHPRTVAQLEDW
jgi:hypothetical protein